MPSRRAHRRHWREGWGRAGEEQTWLLEEEAGNESPVPGSNSYINLTSAAWQTHCKARDFNPWATRTFEAAFCGELAAHSFSAFRSCKNCKEHIRPTGGSSGLAASVLQACSFTVPMGNGQTRDEEAAEPAALEQPPRQLLSLLSCMTPSILKGRGSGQVILGLQLPHR